MRVEGKPELRDSGRPGALSDVALRNIWDSPLFRLKTPTSKHAPR